MDKRILQANRRRQIKGSFGWIEHRFMREGHMKVLSRAEILLYFFLALVSDKNGISFYGPERTICLLKLDEADYYRALAALEAKDYICRQGNKIQLMSLPASANKEPALPGQRFNQSLSLAQILQEAGDGQ